METWQRPVEALAVPHVAATTVPTAKATLAQLEKEELDDKEPNYSCRGGLRCLGQYYATQLNRRTMAHLRSDLKVDGELRQEFEKLLAKDAVDWKAWEEMTKWTFPESDESDDDYDAQHHGNYA
ncbi:hypothetical protein D9Q98_003619 [Chlorella vulgaris]|uniref:Uncharacterized protein n=1 Tax=Chlorella vulgaris TaxID=3077 RepID=A0A9D4TT94_CHLVU|nr:hypothetical protein D9Q98_003619 [Chlorella vulgaris]